MVHKGGTKSQVNYTLRTEQCTEIHFLHHFFSSVTPPKALIMSLNMMLWKMLLMLVSFLVAAWILDIFIISQNSTKVGRVFSGLTCRSLLCDMSHSSQLQTASPLFLFLQLCSVFSPSLPSPFPFFPSLFNPC